MITEVDLDGTPLLRTWRKANRTQENQFHLRTKRIRQNNTFQPNSSNRS